MERKPAKCVSLDPFVEIHVQQFSRDAEMVAEVEALCEIDDAVLALGILIWSVPGQQEEIHNLPTRAASSIC